MSSSSPAEGPAQAVPGALPDGDEAPGTADTARALFGPGYEAACVYASMLTGLGVERGVIGPREAGRVWTRHLLNSVVVEELIPAGARVVDIGSGAGLPGIPVALARPDLTVVLVDSMLRRCAFLTEVVAELGLQDRVEVVRGRAPEVRQEGLALSEVALSRAVAPLSRLTLWTVPLLRVGGVMLALRGASAVEEVRECAADLSRAAVDRVEVVRCGSDRLVEPTLVVRAFRAETRRRPTGGRSGAGDRRRGLSRST